MQAGSQDLHNATQSVQDCITVLQEMRTDETFHRLFKQAEKEHGDEIQIPKMRNRENKYPADNSEEYYRRSVFFPYLDICMDQLRERFNAQADIAYSLSRLLPAFVTDLTDTSKLRASIHFYESLLPGGVECFEVEFMRWKTYWKRQPEEIRLDTLCEAEKLGTYPMIEALLRIFATLPVTMAPDERIFSSTKHIKSYLRSTMKEDRLKGLAHLYINKDIKIDHDQVIDEFEKENQRIIVLLGLYFMVKLCFRCSISLCYETIILIVTECCVDHFVDMHRYHFRFVNMILLLYIEIIFDQLEICISVVYSAKNRFFITKILVCHTRTMFSAY